MGKCLHHLRFNSYPVLDQDNGSICTYGRPDDVLAGNGSIRDVLGREHDEIERARGGSSFMHRFGDVGGAKPFVLAVMLGVDRVTMFNDMVIVGPDHQGNVTLLVECQRKGSHGTHTTGTHNKHIR